MDKREKELKKLINRCCLVKYCFEGHTYTTKPLWCADYLLDNVDREIVLSNIVERKYDLDKGVYLYKTRKHNFKLYAIITKKGVKIRKWN